MTPKTQILSSLTPRQKAIGAAVAIIFLIILWQIYGLFRSGEQAAPPPPVQQPKVAGAMSQTSPTSPAMPMTAQDSMPHPAPVPRPTQSAQLTPQEAQLMRMQQEIEAKYVAALNELQMLRIERDIAETNKAIASAKLDTVSAQKGIVTLLAPPPPPPVQESYQKSLINPLQAATGAAKANEEAPVTPPEIVTPPPAPVVNYTVVTVSQLLNRWSAVMGHQGNLYSVSIGDILPPDGSKVIQINRSGVIIEKNGERRKISLVPII